VENESMSVTTRQSLLSTVRFPLLVLGMLSLVLALWGGLGRLGWALGGGRLMALHGPLMVGGFLGTLLGVERAIALCVLWPYLAPAFTALGALGLLLGLPVAPLFVLGSLGLCVIFCVIMQRQADLSTVTMTTSAVLWVVGNSGWWLGWPLPHVIPWWGCFLVLTIAGERLELSRMLRLSEAQRGAFVLGGGVLLVGLVMSLMAFDRGVRLYGAGMMATAWWLLRYDIARRTVRQQGVTRYIALCLLSGYVWLGLGGLLTWYFGGVLAGLHYDAMLHSIFVGFVFAMIFGHAPIIFPAVFGRAVSYHAMFYLPLLGLHLALGLRVVGDLSPWLPGRLWGGLGNALSIMVFFVLLGMRLRHGVGTRKPLPAVVPSPPTR
jgi:hypothetical protein